LGDFQPNIFFDKKSGKNCRVSAPPSLCYWQPSKDFCIWRHFVWHSGSSKNKGHTFSSPLFFLDAPLLFGRNVSRKLWGGGLKILFYGWKDCRKLA